MASSMEHNASSIPLNPQAALLDTFFPGFSLFSAALYRFVGIDITLYIPAVLAIGLIVVASQYVSDYLWEKMEAHFMSTADIRVDDEIYNMFVAWIAAQKFAKNSRRFVPQTNLNSRSWTIWHSRDSDDEMDEEDEDESESSSPYLSSTKKNKPLQYTPSFGMHYFWYKGRLLLYQRTQAPQQQSFLLASEREEMSISSFGRNPTILKELLDECRTEYLKNDEKRTIIYRGSVKPGTTEPVWTRCMSRISRPFSTVVLDESVKQSLLDDMQDYLNPLTQRWYSNRGIPYRRGYLLYGPAGTGKTSFSLAIAGYFKLKIYIVSLNSLAMNEENLSTLFAELPKRCVVLLEDIDTAGLTHTRQPSEKAEEEPAKAGSNTTTTTTVVPNSPGRISLSALLNVLDGVASQEGRVLIMTTNHIEKLDDALIRPGRVDMTVKFGLADKIMVKTLFAGIFATLEGDHPKNIPKTGDIDDLSTPRTAATNSNEALLSSEDAVILKTERQKAEEAGISALADEFTAFIPADAFSPAEIQGYLLKNKRNPEAALSGAEQWVKDTLAQKKKNKEEEQEKKAREAEEGKRIKEKETAGDEEAGEEGEDKTEKEDSTTGNDKLKKPLTNGVSKGIDKETMTNGISKEDMTDEINGE